MKLYAIGIIEVLIIMSVGASIYGVNQEAFNKFLGIKVEPEPAVVIEVEKPAKCPIEEKKPWWRW